MRISTLLVAPLAICVAADQIPIQAWWDKLSSYIPKSVAHPIDTASAKSASKYVVPITLNNWKSTLSPHPSPKKAQPEEWWVLITGGNNTCFGACGRAEKSFNESATLLHASSKAPHFAMLNCESEQVLCMAWSAATPSIWHILLPATADGPTTIRIKELNSTTVTASEIMSMHTTKNWKNLPVYEGRLHPFDGILAKLGLNIPLGYALWVFSNIPSWVFMVGISFLSRTFMSRRTGTQPAAAGTPGAAAGPLPGDAT